jgi:hypothetical protein
VGESTCVRVCAYMCMCLTCGVQQGLTLGASDHQVWVALAPDGGVGGHVELRDDEDATVKGVGSAGEEGGQGQCTMAAAARGSTATTSDSLARQTNDGQSYVHNGGDVIGRVDRVWGVGARGREVGLQERESEGHNSEGHWGLAGVPSGPGDKGTKSGAKQVHGKQDCRADDRGREEGRRGEGEGGRMPPCKDWRPYNCDVRKS